MTLLIALDLLRVFLNSLLWTLVCYRTLTAPPLVLEVRTE